MSVELTATVFAYADKPSICPLLRKHVAVLAPSLLYSAFRGQTPDEVYFGTDTEIPGNLDAKRKAARATRMAVNRERSCLVCL